MRDRPWIGVYRYPSGRYDWALKDRNDRVLFRSAERFSTEEAAEAAADQARAAFAESLSGEWHHNPYAKEQI